MPKIPYEAVAFPNGLPLWHANGTMPAQGVATASRAAIWIHAISVGTPWGQPWWKTFGHHTPGFARSNLIWRGDAVSSSLVNSGDHWTLDPKFEELDSSEKTFLSYLMGMTQASLIAEHILGALAMVHVDAVLRTLGRLDTGAKRPDLIGFHRGTTAHASSNKVPPGRILAEAKGTSGKKTRNIVRDALKQIKPTSRISPNRNLQQLALLLGPNALRIASVAHFLAPPGQPHGADVWSSYLHDPPHEETEPPSWDDDEFLGLLIIAKLLPLYTTLRTEAADSFTWPEYVDAPMSTFQLSERVMVGFPAAFIEIFGDYLSTGFEELQTRDHRQLRQLCRTLASKVASPARLAPRDRPEHEGWDTAMLRSGLTLALDIR